MVSLFGVFAAAYALPNRNPVANADSDGFARLTKFEFPVDADDTLRLFYLEFTSNPLHEPGIFGVFWHMPVFDSNVSLNGANELQWYALDGKTYYFCAHSAEKRGREVVAYTDNTGTWRAEKKKNGFEIKSLEDETSHTYADGRLTELTLKNNRRLMINYRRDGLVSSVKDKAGSTVLAFEYYNGRKHIKSIRTRDGAYNFKYHQRKAREIFGGDNFYGQAPLLSEVECPGKTVETFEYARSMMRPRVILLKDLNEITTSPLRVNRMSVASNGEPKGWLEWCAATGIIMADNGGVYGIGNDKYDSFFPNFKPGQGANKFSAIKYKGENMPYPRIRLLDYENYYEILGDASTGEITRNSKIGSCGPLKMKTRKVERLMGDIKSLSNPAAADWSLVKANSYDDKGRIVRELYSNGDVIAFNYGKSGQVYEKFLNGELIFFDARRTDVPKEKDNELLWFFERLNDGTSRRIVSTKLEPNVFMHKVQSASGEVFTTLRQDVKSNVIEAGGFKIFATNK